MQPTLLTSRLILRPFMLHDAETVADLAGQLEVSKPTERIPHPYTKNEAAEWIHSHASWYENQSAAIYAVCDKCTGEIYGCVSIVIELHQNRAELGYWIGAPYWNNGYCTEAARSILQFSFGKLRIRKLTSAHLKGNLASRAVLRKLNFNHEGTRYRHVFRFDIESDLEIYGLHADDYIEALIPRLRRWD